MVDRATVPKRFIKPTISIKKCEELQKALKGQKNIIYAGTSEHLANFTIWRTFVKGLRTKYFDFNAFMRQVKGSKEINHDIIEEVVTNHNTILTFAFADKTKFSTFEIDTLEYILQTKYYAGTPTIFIKGVKERLEDVINSSLYKEIFS